MAFKGSSKLGLIIIGLISLSAAIGISLFDPIAQDTEYHNFADSRYLLGIPNFWNVVSNLAFFIVGLFGTHQLVTNKALILVSEIRFIYFTLFAGVALVALGSGYYHLWPDNQTLVWDRLPMTVTFMALFCIVVAEFVSVRWGRLLFWPLAVAGAGSVLFWHLGELNGQGDLRLYVLVQFLPILLIPIILLCFHTQFSRSAVYWLLLLTYVLAKIFEHLDAEIFTLTGFISGHSLKHLLAAVGLWLLIQAYQKRVVGNP